MSVDSSSFEMDKGRNGPNDFEGRVEVDSEVDKIPLF